LTYGVTFPLQGSDTALPVLDSLLEHYSQFSSPTVIHEDKEKDGRMEKNPEEDLHIASRGMNIPGDGKPDDYNGMVVPPQQVTRMGRKWCRWKLQSGIKLNFGQPWHPMWMIMGPVRLGQ
jgi:hypothetical protein